MAEPRPTPLRASRRLPELSEVEGWTGRRVDDLNGSPVGEVDSVIPDGTGVPTWIVVCALRAGEGRRYAIPVADAVAADERVWSPHSRERIRGTGPLVKDLGTPGCGARLREHYARVPGRRAA